jgi:hypothetical protein
MLEMFDAPTLTPNCDLRSQSTVAPQSLLLMNNEFILQQAQALAERAISTAGDDRQAQVRLAWRLALAAQPTPEQLDAALAFMAEQEREFAAADKVKPAPASKEKLPAPRVRSLASLCQALFSSNAFLYVD